MNKLKYVLLFLLFIILIGCNSKVTEEDLIGGSWEATAGYKDGKPEGEPYGSSVNTEGLEFTDEETVYVDGYKEEFEYKLEREGNKTIISFKNSDLGFYISYYIDKIDNNAVGLRGVGKLQEDESCYLERK